MTRHSVVGIVFTIRGFVRKARQIGGIMLPRIHIVLSRLALEQLPALGMQSGSGRGFDGCCDLGTTLSRWPVIAMPVYCRPHLVEDSWRRQGVVTCAPRCLPNPCDIQPD